MKKENYYKILDVISILLIVGFIVILTTDYVKYNPVTTSFPFDVYVLVRGLEFLLPSLILFIIRIFIKKFKK